MITRSDLSEHGTIPPVGSRRTSGKSTPGPSSMRIGVTATGIRGSGVTTSRPKVISGISNTLKEELVQG